MKATGIRYVFLLLITTLAFSSIYGQDYLVTIKGDTLVGEVKPLNFGPEKKVQIKEADKKKEVLSMFQVAYFALGKDTFYPVKGPNGYSFMKLLKPGYLTLYAFQAEGQVSYDGRFLYRKDGRGIEVPNLGFKKAMNNFLSDCHSVTTRIENGELVKRDLEKIVDEYNACIVASTSERLPVASKPTIQKETTSWDVLAEKVKAHESFAGKEDAVEMIEEIKGKVSKSEKVPNFLVEGLKAAVTPADLQEDLQKALSELKPQ